MAKMKGQDQSTRAPSVALLDTPIYIVMYPIASRLVVVAAVALPIPVPTADAEDVVAALRLHRRHAAVRAELHVAVDLFGSKSATVRAAATVSPSRPLLQLTFCWNSSQVSPPGWTATPSPSS